MNCIASLTLLESGNLELMAGDETKMTSDDLTGIDRLAAIQALWDDKRLTDILDQWIESDMGEVPFE